MADLSSDELRQRVVQKRIGAISIDTNVFTRFGYRLDAGLLKRIRLFAEAGIDFVLADVVERELRRHKRQGLREAAKMLDTALAKAGRLGLIPSSAEAAARASAAVPEAVAESDIDAFKLVTSAIVADARDVDVGVLLDVYFDASPPFEERADKKHEFPDAIALMSLEHWAGQRDVEILVVSEDKGWLAFARGSQRLHAVRRLADAFDAFSEPVRNSQVLSAIEAALAGVDRDRITSSLQEELEGLSPYLDAHSFFHVEVELESLSLSEVGFAGIDRRAFRQVESSCNEDGHTLLSLQITVPLTLDIEASASFSVYDGIDRDYTQLANDSLSFEHEFEAEVLLTYSVRHLDDRVEVELQETELLTRPGSIDLGELEPDFGPPDDV